MALVIEDARKEQSKLRLGLYGPSGGGKTLTALMIGLALAGGDPKKLGVIDTEHRSAAKYAHKIGPFRHVELPTFTAELYLEGLSLLVSDGAPVIVIDSFSHAWEGAGGILDRQTTLTEQANGDSQQGWNKVKQFEKKLWNGVLSSEVHLIVTMRSRNEWHIYTDEKGKKKREIIGLEPVQRKGSEYEFDILALMSPEDDGDHHVNLRVEKSRYEEVPRRLEVKDPAEPFISALMDAVSAGEAPEPATDEETKLLKELLTAEGKEERRIDDVLDAEKEKSGGVLPQRFVRRAIEQSRRRLDAMNDENTPAAA